MEVGAEASRNLKPSQASDGNTKTQRHRNPKTSWADVGNTQFRNTHIPKANASRRGKHQAPKPPKKPKPARGGVGNSKHKLTYCITVSGMSPRWDQDGAKSIHELPRLAMTGPKSGRDKPNMAKDGAKMRPRWGQDGPRWAKMGPR